MSQQALRRSQPFLVLRPPGKPRSTRPVEDFERSMVEEPKQTRGTQVCNGIILYLGVTILLVVLAWLGFFRAILP